MNSFSSVSLEPPLILFSLDRKARSLPAMQTAEGYAVNVLARGQQALAERFARPRPDKWQTVEHASGIADAPLIAGALARFECLPHACHDGGDHLIFVGRVVRFETFTDDEPLVFFGGEYRRIAQHGTVADWPLPIHY
jgi:flavin reductase (DIM6/NTAB) family NADH-FMN oxidoreductase RutF